MTDLALLELRRLSALVAEQGEALADLQVQLLGKHDRRTGQRLLPALARLVGSAAFSVGDAAALALNQTTPHALVVCDWLEDCGDFRSAGRQLLRLQGVRINGQRLERHGAERWRVFGR